MINALRIGLPELPWRMQGLKVDERGYPVPFFVALVNGKPDHRIADPSKVPEAVRFNKCWLCGCHLGSFKTFVIGPMCVLTRTNSEPPSHIECAQFAVRACPFMLLPNAKRREANKPDNAVEPPGIMIKRNPGVMCLWTTKSFKSVRLGWLDRRTLFDIGEAIRTEWWAEGRAATREEVVASISSGLPELRKHFDPIRPEEDERDLDNRLRYITRMLDQVFVPTQVTP